MVDQNVHAYRDDALGDFDAVALAEQIRTGAVSRREVVEAAIERTNAVNDRLNAVQMDCFEQARADTERPRGGVFSGVPTFVKDNTDVAGLPTCHGSSAFTPHPAKQNGGPAAQFLSAGFELLGKTTLPEFGLTASTEFADRPPTRNPWNLDYSVGASSGGSAALVAAGAVPIAHANDGGGSIRIPAAVNGLVGLKATRCRMLDQPGVRQLPVNLVAEGVLTRTVRDTAHYFAAAEQYRQNTVLAPIGLVEGPSDRKLRIGVVRRDLYGRLPHPEIAQVTDSAAGMLAGMGHEVSDVSLEFDERLIEDFKLYWSMFAVAMSASFKAHHGRRFRPSELDPFTKGLAHTALGNPLRIVPAVRRLRRATGTYEEQFTDFDVLLTPVLSQPTPLIGEHRPDQPFEKLFATLVDYVGFTPINNVGGGPALALPHGHLASGLPGSVQILARGGDERTLLDLAYQVEAQSPFPRITATAEM
ncbi:MAG: amidase [Rhodococcus sp.]|nr:amidase [Rhodococcus sp. (in: high G+C Gram-positive bacteria)]